MGGWDTGRSCGDCLFAFQQLLRGKKRLLSLNIYLLSKSLSSRFVSRALCACVCVERAAEMGFVLNTVEILYLLKQGQNNEHSSANELDELPLSGK